MKYLFSWMLICCCGSGMAQATRNFDIFTCTVPRGWQADETAAYLLVKKDNGLQYCSSYLMKAAASLGTARADFDAAWKQHAAKHGATAPAGTSTGTQQGWEVTVGYAQASFEGKPFYILVSSFTGKGTAYCVVHYFNDEKFSEAIAAFTASVTADAARVTAPANTAPPAATGGMLTRFDDGWVSVPREGWVETTKGSIRAFIHYPDKKIDAYNPDGMQQLKTAWDGLVAMRYSNAVNMDFKSGNLYFTEPDYGQAELTDNATGKRVYVVLYRTPYANGSGKWVEIIAPDKKTFEQEFGSYENNKAAKNWLALDKMQGRNKFAVWPGGLTGTWTSDFGAAVNYVYVSTGLNAGMETHSSAESFRFAAGGRYEWSLSMATGQVGSMQFKGGKSAGTATISGGWAIRFSDISGRPKQLAAYFSCIRGLRILWLDEKPYAKKD